jgi:hypothetical protein
VEGSAFSLSLLAGFDLYTLILIPRKFYPKFVNLVEDFLQDFSREVVEM